jgi:hypothetical protein
LPAVPDARRCRRADSAAISRFHLKAPKWEPFSRYPLKRCQLIAELRYSQQAGLVVPTRKTFAIKPIDDVKVST